MLFDAETIIKEVALKNNVALSRDDPILVMATMLNLYAVHQREQLSAMVDNLKNEMEDAITNISADSKGLAEKLISASVGAAQKRAENMFSVSADKFNTALAATLSDFKPVAQPTKTDNKITRLTYFNAGISVLSLLTLLSILLARYIM